MARTYRRCFNKRGKPIPVDKTMIKSYCDWTGEWWCYPVYKYLGDHGYEWNMTHFFKESEKTARRVKDKAMIRKILQDKELANEDNFIKTDYYNVWR